MNASAEEKLFLVRLVHSIIWTFFVAVIGYVLYAGIADVIDFRVWAAIAAVIIEGAVLAWNGWKCPLTLIGARYTDDTADNFDIFLPVWLARNNKMIFSIIFGIGVLIVLYRCFD